MLHVQAGARLAGLIAAKELSQFNFPISANTSPTRKRENLIKMQ